MGRIVTMEEEVRIGCSFYTVWSCKLSTHILDDSGVAQVVCLEGMMEEVDSMRVSGGHLS